MNKKIIFALGNLSVISVPLLTVVACSKDNPVVDPPVNNPPVNDNADDNNEESSDYDGVDLTTSSGKALKKAIIDMPNAIFSELDKLKISNTKLNGNQNFEYTIEATGKKDEQVLSFKVILNFNLTNNIVKLNVKNSNNIDIEISTTIHKFFSNASDFSKLFTTEKKAYDSAVNLIDVTSTFWTEDVLKEEILTEFITVFNAAFSQEPVYKNIDLINDEMGQALKKEILQLKTQIDSEFIFTELDELKISNLEKENKTLQMSLWATGRKEFEYLTIEIIGNIDFANGNVEWIMEYNNEEVIIETNIFQMFNEGFKSDSELPWSQKKVAEATQALFLLLADFDPVSGEFTPKYFLFERFNYEFEKFIMLDYAYSNIISDKSDLKNIDLTTESGIALKEAILNNENTVFAEVNDLTISNIKLKDGSFSYFILIGGKNQENHFLSLLFNFNVNFTSGKVDMSFGRNNSFTLNEWTITKIKNGFTLDDDYLNDFFAGEAINLLNITSTFWTKDALQPFMLEEFVTKFNTEIGTIVIKNNDM